MRLISILLALLLALAGCGGDASKTSRPERSVDDFTEGVVTPAPPKRLAWSQPADIVGENGNKLRITPLGLLYYRGSTREYSTRPENGWFVAIALKGEAVDRPDSVAAPISGGGFMWQGQGERINSVEGNAVITPWVGAVHEFSNIPIQPGEPEVGIETFDVPSKTGGRLEYVSPHDQSITSWDLPAADQGTGLDKVRKKIKQFS